MLLNEFYTLQDAQHDDHSFSCKVTFNQEHDIFKGHFPDQPVVPGVCMMQMVKELLEELLGSALWMRNVVSVKFLQLITPNIEPVININWNHVGEGYMVKAAFLNEAATLFKLDGNFENF